MVGTGEVDLDEVFRALADPSRRTLLDRLRGRDGQTLRELCDGLAMARQSVSKHLAVLEAAHLVTAVRRGREKHHFLNVVPINAIADRWISTYDAPRVAALADLKTALEQTVTTTDPTEPAEFVYATYIRTTPERLWQALTDPTFIRQYWGVALTSDWSPGATITWEVNGATLADEHQVVLEADPPRRLAYTWHSITPTFGEAIGADPEEIARLAREPRSHVAFDLEPEGDVVKLTVTHGGFAPDSEILPGISDGWPEIVASLKSLLETGTPLATVVG